MRSFFRNATVAAESWYDTNYLIFHKKFNILGIKASRKIEIDKKEIKTIGKRIRQMKIDGEES